MNEPFSNPSQPLPPPEDLDEAKSMDALRDLLFGKKNREIDEQMGGVERRLTDAIEALERRLNSRIDALEQSVGSEKELQQRLDGVAGEMNGRFDHLEEKVSRHETDVQNEIAERSRVIDGLRATLNGEVAAMKQQVTPRGELSDLFLELGRRVQGESSEGDDDPHEG